MYDGTENRDQDGVQKASETCSRGSYHASAQPESKDHYHSTYSDATRTRAVLDHTSSGPDDSRDFRQRVEESLPNSTALVEHWNRTGTTGPGREMMERRSEQGPRSPSSSCTDPLPEPPSPDHGVPDALMTPTVEDGSTRDTGLIAMFAKEIPRMPRYGEQGYDGKRVHEYKAFMAERVCTEGAKDFSKTQASLRSRKMQAKRNKEKMGKLLVYNKQTGDSQKLMLKAREEEWKKWLDFRATTLSPTSNVGN